MRARWEANGCLASEYPENFLAFAWEEICKFSENIYKQKLSALYLSSIYIFIIFFNMNILQFLSQNENKINKTPESHIMQTRRRWGPKVNDFPFFPLLKFDWFILRHSYISFECCYLLCWSGANAQLRLNIARLMPTYYELSFKCFASNLLWGFVVTPSANGIQFNNSLRRESLAKCDARMIEVTKWLMRFSIWLWLFDFSAFCTDEWQSCWP